MVAVWFEFYESKFRIKPTFDGAATAGLKSIAQKLKNLPVPDGREWNEEYVKLIFSHFFIKAYADQWRKENFMLHILSAHFDAIIQKDESTTKGNSKPDLSDYKRELARKMGGTTS